MPHNFAHFTNEMTPFIQQLQSGEITPDQFRQAFQNVETQQQDIVNNPIIGSPDFQDPLDMGTGTGALSNLDPLDPSSTRKPFPTAGENLTDEEYQQRIKDLYHNAGLPAPGEPGYNPLITPDPLIDLPEDYVPPEINPLTGQPNVPQPVAQDLGEDGSPQPPEQPQLKNAYLNSTTGNAIPNFKRGSSFVYMVDQDTGRSYQYDDNEGKSGDTGWVGGTPPEGSNLKITGINIKEDGERKNLDLSGLNLGWGGMTDPLTSAAYQAQVDDEPGYESGGGGLFYEYNGTPYYTPDNTGSGIPVGSTNIGRTMEKDSLQLEKTYEGYQAPTGATTEELLESVPDSGTFLEAFTPQTKGGRPFDLGKVFGLNEGVLEFSNPPSNRFNVGGFFNQAESQGTDNFLRSQQQDTLQMIKDGNIFTALAGGKRVGDTFVPLDKIYPTLTGQEGLNEVLNQLQGIDNDPTTVNRIDPSFEVDPFGTDSDSQVASISGDDEGTDANPETPEETDPFVVRAYQGGGVGPFASNYIFQRFGYRPTETIDMLLRYDPVQELYFFENGQPVDPEFLQNMQLTKLDDEGQVVKDDDGKPVRMPKVVIDNKEEE